MKKQSTAIIDLQIRADRAKAKAKARKKIIELTLKGNKIEFQKQQLIWTSYDNFESPQQKDRKIEELQDELNGIAHEIRSIEEMLNA